MKNLIHIISFLIIADLHSAPPSNIQKSAIVERLLNGENVEQATRCVTLRFSKNMGEKMKRMDLANELASRMFDSKNIRQSIAHQLHMEFDASKFQQVLDWRATSGIYQKINKIENEASCRPLLNPNDLDPLRRKMLEDLYFAMRNDYFERQSLKAFSKEYALALRKYLKKAGYQIQDNAESKRLEYEDKLLKESWLHSKNRTIPETAFTVFVTKYNDLSDDELRDYTDLHQRDFMRYYMRLITFGSYEGIRKNCEQIISE